MSLAPAPVAAVAPRPAAPVTAAAAAPADPGERGLTTLAPRVVEKIAAQAASEIGPVCGLPRRVAGLPVGGERVRADAGLDGTVATVRLQLAAAFPVPLIQLTRQVRDHVTARIEALCGVRVDHVDITIAALRSTAAGRRRVQ